MKKVTLTTAAILAYCLLLTANCFSQGTAINANGANPDNSAILDAASTTKGFLLPRMTTTERNNIVSPAQSLLIFNTTTTCFEYHYSGVWYSMSCTCVVPFAPTANTATNVTDTSFAANWNTSAGAASYYLDVATDTAFTGFVPGYNNLNVGGVTSYSVTGITCNTTYYHRVRAANSCGTSANSNTVSDTTSTCWSCGTSTVQDIDLNTYNTVLIGSQCWTKENLKVSKNPSGSPVSYYCPNGDCNTYGALYDWAVAVNGAAATNNNPSGVQGICPNGWHVPSDAEWQVMEISLGMTAGDAASYGNRTSGNVGQKIKSASPTWDGTNSSGFSAIATGYVSGGGYTDSGLNAKWWSTTEGSSSDKRIFRGVSTGDNWVVRDDNSYTGGWVKQISIRCVKD